MARGAGSLYRHKYKDRTTQEMRESPFWYGRFTDQRGRQVQFSTGTSVKADAQRKLNQRMGQVAQGTYEHRADKIAVRDITHLMKKDYELNERVTYWSVQPCLSRLEEWFGDTPVLRIGPTAKDYIAAQVKKGYSRATVQKDLRMLGRMLKLAALDNIIPYKPVLPTVAGAKVVREDYWTVEEMKALLRVSPDWLRPVILFAYHTGWRESEVLGLTWNRVNWETGEVKLTGGKSAADGGSKNRKSRSFPFSEHPALKALLEERHAVTRKWEKENGAICRSVFHNEGRALQRVRKDTREAPPTTEFRRAWEQARQASGKPGGLFHDLRRSARINYAEAGVDPKDSMALMGHLTMTTHLDYNVRTPEAKRRAVARLAAHSLALEE